MTAPEFKHTMKVIVSPGGRMIPAIRASERRTGGKGCIGWRSPQASDGEGGVMEIRPDCAGKYKLRDEAALVHWSTPTVQDSANNAGPSQFDRNTHPLNVQATLAAWPTPQEDNANNSAGHKGTTFSDLPTVAGLATPRAEDAESAGMRHSRGVADTLSAQAGQDASRSNAATGSIAAYRLNPFFSLNLMGYPISWGLAGIRSWLKSRKR